MIALYKDPQYHDTLTFGRFHPFEREQKNLIAYERKNGEQTILVLVNFQKEPQTVTISSGDQNAEWKVLLNNTDIVDRNGDQITLCGYQALVVTCD